MKGQKIIDTVLRAIFLVSFLIASISVYSQKYILNRGTITFFSEATLEDIKADNEKVSSIFNVSTSEIAFSIPNSEFQFEKKLMQQHFNEKYMETDKYPRSTFSGKLLGFTITTPGEQLVKAVGKLTIHGVTKEVEVPGAVEVKSDGISMKAMFIVKLADHKIKIPQIMWQNIAEQVEVTVNLAYNPQ